MMSAGARGLGLSLTFCLSILPLSALQEFTWSEKNSEAIPGHITCVNDSMYLDGKASNIATYSTYTRSEGSISYEAECNKLILHTLMDDGFIPSEPN